MSVLNAAFSSHGFSFELINIKTWIYDDWWGNDEGDLSGQMKAATRVGGCNALNIWFSQFSDRKLLGTATFPPLCAIEQSQDGVVCSHSSINNGTWDRYDEGDVLVHEVGHWLNLYHSKC